VPLTGGFSAVYIFQSRAGVPPGRLTVLGLLNSAVAAYYYLRILVVMYMYEPGEATENSEPLTAGRAPLVAVPARGHVDSRHLPIGGGVRRLSLQLYSA